MNKKQITKKNIGLCIYWETIANSGLWEYSNDERLICFSIAKDLVTKKHVNTVKIIDLKNKLINILKG